MQYPLISEYIEAIRYAEDNFDKLNNLRPVLDDNGNPIMSSGNFAVVFKMKDENTGKLYAVKCFTRDQEHRNENYQKIAEELEFVSSPYFVHFHFMEKELFVDTTQSDEEEFPVLMMDWVDGQPLDVYLREHISNDYERQMLAYRFCHMGAWLLSQPFAHGDLKPDNILVRNDGTLVLVDYDGMYVPSMQGQKAQELGSPDYRHPLRTEDDFDEHIDDFTIASIALSLKAISLDASLYNKYGATDRLLFSAKDYTDLSKSPIMSDLLALAFDGDMKKFISIFFLASATNNLEAISFRVLLLTEPKKPMEEYFSTEVTDEELKNAVEDEYGVLYSANGKKLIKAPHQLESYEIKIGTKVIAKEAFGHSFGALQYIQLINKGDDALNCSDILKDIYIPDSVTRIGDFAFAGCFTIQEINIPNSVTNIGNNAFEYCIALRHINIPISVKSIGDDTFAGCKAIQEINIPNSVTNIGDSAFMGCSALQRINIPNSVTDIGYFAFLGCKALQNIDIPNSVTSIGDNTFDDCSTLQKINIPNSVTNIGDEAFKDCSSLHYIYIPNSVKNIGDKVFEGCTSLQRISIPKGSLDKFKNILFDYKSLLIEE